MPGAQRGRIEAQAVHAGVELEPDVEWNIQAGGEERLALFRALDHQVQAQLPGEGVFARLEAAFQQQDARAGVQGADFRGLLRQATAKPSASSCNAVTTSRAPWP